jgi:MFS family permease
MTDKQQETRRDSMLAIFRNRNFARLWAGQTVSEFGTGLTSIAASLLVFRETGSALSVGLMLMATALPGLLFGLIAGVFVDRLDRKRIMVVSEIIRAVLIALIPLLAPLGIGWLYLLIALSSTVAQFYDPAHASILPDVATDEELAKANSLLSATQIGALGLGFAAAGLIAGELSIELAFFVDALTFLVSAGAIALVNVKPIETEQDSSVAAVVSNLKSGFQFLFASPILRSLLWTSIPMAVLFGFHNALELPFVDRALGANEFEYGLIEGLSMIGFFLGGIWMASVADRLREGQWIALSFIVMGLSTVVLSQVKTVPLAIVIGVIAAFANVPSFVARRLIIQRQTTREVRGRVASVFFVTRDAFFVVGMGTVALADFLDIRMLMLIEGALLSLVGVVTILLPGLGQHAREWRQAIGLLRGAAEAQGISHGRSATLADLEKFAGRVPALANLSLPEQQRIVTEMRYLEAEPGTVVVRQHETSDAAYFLLEGRVVAGRPEDGEEKVLEVLNGGDFFGEIAALTGIPRTANVVVQESAVLLRVPADTLRQMAAKPDLNRLFMEKMTERMILMKMLDIPRVVGPDQALMKELRTPDPAHVSSI